MKTQITNQHIDSRNAHNASVAARRPVGSFGRIFTTAVLQLAIVALVATMARAQDSPQVISGSTPGLVSQSRNLGPEDPGKQISVSVWLKRHNDAAFQQLLKQQYTRGSAAYHHWLTTEQYGAMFAPSATEAAEVGNFLKSHNLTVTKTDKYNQFVTAEGRVADVQSAFNVQIDRFELNGKVYRANTSDVAIEGPAGALALAVLGLDDLTAETYGRRPLDPATGRAIQVPLNQSPPAGFTGNCWGVPETDKFSLSSNSYFQYSGNKYAGTKNYSSGICGYNPSQVQHAYDIDQAINNGYDGTGQTVSIVIGYGSPTISADLNVFNIYFGLPAPTFIITDPQNIGSNGSANQEATLDVEWSHALAPGAWIDLFVAADMTPANLLSEELAAITDNCPTVNSTTQCSYQISNSWGAPESWAGPYLSTLDSIAATAASKGISVNFASGDSGDYLQSTGTIQASWPASDPNVTAVGGTSMFLKNDNSGNILFQTGWGTNATQIVQGGTPISPNFLGFQYGAGGGVSMYFGEPSWQAAYGLTGNRHVPDIAYLADPYTGALFIESYDQLPNQYAIAPIGGTSLAAPMFSGVWSITNQWTIQHKGVTTSLGLAAGNLYTSGGIAGITDIQQSSYSSQQPADVWGEYCVLAQPYGVCDFYPSFGLAGLPFNWGAGPDAVSALFEDSPTTNNWYVLTFGTDSSLHTEPGWDNVTGLGVPNGWNFVTAFIPPTPCWSQNGQIICD